MPSPPSLEVLSVVPAHEIETVGKGQVSASSSDRNLLLQGWVIGNSTPVGEIEIATAENRIVARAPVGMPRPDLIRAYDGAIARRTEGELPWAA